MFNYMLAKPFIGFFMSCTTSQQKKQLFQGKRALCFFGVAVVLTGGALTVSLRGGGAVFCAIAPLFFIFLVCRYFLVRQRESADSARNYLLMKTMMDSMPHMAWALDKSGKVIFTNSKFDQISQQITGLNELPKNLFRTSKTDPIETEMCFRDKKDQETHFLINHLPVLGLKNELQGSIGLGHDLTSTKKSDQYKKLTSQVFDSSSEGIVISDCSGAIILANKAIQELSGFSLDELKNSNVRNLHPQSAVVEINEILEHVISKGHWEGELEGVKPNGSVYPQRVFFDSIKDNAEVMNIVAIYNDISDQKKRDSQILALAKYDLLTGLPNRYSFNEWANKALARAERINQTVAVIFIDLDRFKTINDSIGHPMGDLLLKEIANRLQNAFPIGDCIVARMGGDEFLAGVPYEGAKEFINISNGLLNLISKPVEINGNDFVFSASIGLAVFPHDGVTVDELIMHADMAMYEAKAKGRNRVQQFSAEINKRILLENELSVYLKSASCEEFFLRYQPKVQMQTGAIIGFEALLRWQHPEHGELAPASFISIAEENGSLVRIGQHVLVMVCKQIVRWGKEAKPVAINISATQLKRADFVSEFLSTVDAYNVLRDFIEIEITESVLLTDTEDIAKKIETLRFNGIRVALDDFGTGYSSLSYLTNFGFDSLKIDRSFVSKMETSNANKSVFEFLVNLSQGLGVTLIAEGVETEDQVNRLKNIGCEVGQGWYYGKPLLVKEITEILKNSSLRN